jgi:hypothetical protein
MRKLTFCSLLILGLMIARLGTAASAGQSAQESSNSSSESPAMAIPANPERDLAEHIIQTVRESTSEDDPLLREVQKFREPEAQKGLRKLLEKSVEKGSKQEQAYNYRLLRKQFEIAFSESNMEKRRAELLSRPPTTQQCPVFACNWHICCK